MSFALQVSSTAYAGNGSTSTPYPVAFPIVSKEHVAVAVQIPASAPPVALSPGQFTVHDVGGGNYNVTTAVAYASTSQVTVFRSIPFDQPFEFPEGGIFKTSEVERSMDRIVMQMQQLWRQVTGGVGGAILPGAGSTVRSVAVWADVTARSLVVPAYAGQIGTQLNDNSIWIGRTTTAGDWVAYGIPPELDVWSPDALFGANETVVGGIVGGFVGVVPRPFAVTAVRMSIASNSGRALTISLDIGQSFNVMAELNWPYAVNEDSRLWAYSAWGSTLETNILPAGARVSYTSATTGLYGTEIKGLKLDFLGRWVS